MGFNTWIRISIQAKQCDRQHETTQLKKQKKYPGAHLGQPGLLAYGVPDDVLLSREIQPTIIGAEAFHDPVRDGKGWDHLAMVVRQ